MKKTYRRAQFRKGVSIIECLLLVFIVAVALGSVFSTLSWTSRTYVFTTRDAGSREMLFNWNQTFESLWPNLYPDPEDAFRQVALSMNGRWEGGGRANIGGYFVEAQESRRGDGSLIVNLVIRDNSLPGHAPYTSMDWHYNLFSSETVSDDSIL